MKNSTLRWLPGRFYRSSTLEKDFSRGAFSRTFSNASFDTMATTLQGEKSKGILRKRGHHKNQFNIDCMPGTSPGNKLFKLAHTKNKKKRLIRYINFFDQEDFARMCVVHKKLGPYGVRVFHARFYDNTYVEEVSYLDGLKTLDEVIGNEEDPAKKVTLVLHYTKAIVAMLAYFEKQGLVWPDLKPKNLFIRPGGALCIADAKNIYLNSAAHLPRTAFTPAYTGLSIRVQDMNKTYKKVDLKDYPEHLAHSVLFTLEPLLPDNYCSYAGGMQLDNYFQALVKTNSVFAGKHLLEAPKPNRFSRHVSTGNISSSNVISFPEKKRSSTVSQAHFFQPAKKSSTSLISRFLGILSYLMLWRKVGFKAKQNDLPYLEGAEYTGPRLVK